MPPGTVNKNFWGPVHCVQISVDGLVYVCDRNGDRIQVFTKQGQFIKEFFVAPKTLGTGSVYGILFRTTPGRSFFSLATAPTTSSGFWTAAMAR